jgi:hypothetical protein
MRDDAEIARVLDSHEARNYAGAAKIAQAPRFFFALPKGLDPSIFCRRARLAKYLESPLARGAPVAEIDV